ncbi:MAG: hypothetical protein ABC585_08025 [Candidatus Methanosuratincola petrocarbonis]
MKESLLDMGEELFNGRVKCRECGRWCASWQGLAVHLGKSHGRRAHAAAEGGGGD